MRLFTAALAALSFAPAHHPGCHRTFTVRMAMIATDATFRGTKDVSRAEWRREFYYQRCQRNPQARPFVAWDRRQDRAQWQERRNPPLHGPVIASWFDDSGATACGTHYTYGFASLFLPCGATVTMRGPSGALVRATMEDHGPYVGGRTFDLNPGLKAALGCGDICSVWWR